jgi:hypothetical protein
MPAIARDDKTLNNDLANIKRRKGCWRGRVHNLCRRRYGNRYPLDDDASGRAILTVLMCFGLSLDDTMENTPPWLSSADLKEMHRMSRQMTWKDAFALIPDLTYAEMQACKLWPFTPCDASPDEVRRWQIEKNTKNARERQRRKRQRQREVVQKMRNTSERDEAILQMLVTPIVKEVRGRIISPYEIYGPGWTPVAALVREAKHCNAFLTPRGQQQRNLRQIVHRTVNRLKQRGAVKTMLKGGHYGPVLCVAPGKKGAFSERHSVTPERDAKSNSKTVVYLPNVTAKTMSRWDRASGRTSI